MICLLSDGLTTGTALAGKHSLIELFRQKSNSGLAFRLASQSRRLRGP